MKAQKRNRFWKLHSLLGVVFGLPLFIIFIAGSFAFFEPESINWTQPHYQAPPRQAPPLDPAFHALIAAHPDSNQITFGLPKPYHPVVDIYIRKEGAESLHLWLDPHTGKMEPATPHEADFFHFLVDLHYFNFIPFGREFTGIIAALFFAIILTGIVYQWRSFRSDLRPSRLSLQKSSRWKNIHRFTSALTFPFQFIYAITGATLALGLLLSAPAIYLFFNGDSGELNKTIFPAHMVTAGEQATSPPSPDRALSFSSAEWPDHVYPQFIMIKSEEPLADADSPSTTVIEGKAGRLHFLGQYILTLDQDLGTLHSQTPNSHLGPALLDALVNLHFAAFHSFLIKTLFAATGLLVAASIATGVLILLKRRQESSPDSFSTRALSILSDWVISGLTLSIATGLLAAQLLPAFPLHTFSLTTVVSLVASLLFRSSLRLLTFLGAFTFALLPMAFWLAQDQPPFQTGDTHRNLISFFNASFILIALSIGWLLKSIPSPPNSRDTLK